MTMPKVCGVCGRRVAFASNRVCERASCRAQVTYLARMARGEGVHPPGTKDALLEALDRDIASLKQAFETVRIPEISLRMKYLETLRLEVVRHPYEGVTDFWDQRQYLLRAKLDAGPAPAASRPSTPASEAGSKGGTFDVIYVLVKTRALRKGNVHLAEGKALDLCGHYVGLARRTDCASSPERRSGLETDAAYRERILRKMPLEPGDTIANRSLVAGNLTSDSRYHDQRVTNRVQRSLDQATGEHLEKVAKLAGFCRKPGEPDDVLRERLYGALG